MSDRWDKVAAEAIGSIRDYDQDLSAQFNPSTDVGRGANQRHAELASVLRFLSARKPHTVVEVGTERGGSLWAWTQLLPPTGLVVSVDVDRSLLRDENVTDERVKLVTGDSSAGSTRDQVTDVLDGRGVDFLFIDGDHSRKMVLSDYLAFRGLVKPDGVIGFHDTFIAGRGGWDDVLALQDDTLVVEFTRRDSSVAKFGIGLLVLGTAA